MPHASAVSRTNISGITCKGVRSLALAGALAGLAGALATKPMFVYEGADFSWQLAGYFSLLQLLALADDLVAAALLIFKHMGWLSPPGVLPAHEQLGMVEYPMAQEHGLVRDILIFDKDLRP